MNDSQIEKGPENTQTNTHESLEPEKGSGECEEASAAEESVAPETEPRVEEKDRLASVIADFTSQLAETNRISQEREVVIDRLHQENQRLKQGELEQAQLPVFRDMIRFLDDLKATIVNYEDQPEIDRNIIFRDLNCYKEMVSDILYRYGIEQIEAEVGKDFNSKEQKAVATVAADDLELDRKISRIIRDGFKTENRIIRNVEVEVFRHTAPASETTEQAEAAAKEKNENSPEDK